jgi:hypothetical protein
VDKEEGIVLISSIGAVSRDRNRQARSSVCLSWVDIVVLVGPQINAQFPIIMTSFGMSLLPRLPRHGKDKTDGILEAKERKKKSA